MTTLLKRQMLSDGNRASGNSQKKKSSILSLWHILVKWDWKTTIERMLLDHSLFTIQVQTTLKRNTIIWGSRLLAFYFSREWRSHKVTEQASSVILQRLLWDAAGEHRTQELSPNLRKRKQYLLYYHSKIYWLCGGVLFKSFLELLCYAADVSFSSR